VKRSLFRRPAVAVTAALIGVLAALVPAGPATANHTPAEITSFGCGMATNTTFDCDVTAVVYAGWLTHTRWHVNGSEITAYRGRLHILHSCSANSQVTVRVELWSYWDACVFLRDSRQTSFPCRRRGNL
jgi:hypothetical protein